MYILHRSGVVKSIQPTAILKVGLVLKTAFYPLKCETDSSLCRVDHIENVGR
jgi:hypothetical protein